MVIPRRIMLAVSALALAAGCGRSCKKDHPYVPYSVGDNGASDAGDEASVRADDAHEAHAEAAATEAPAGATRWVLDGLDLGAPDGRVFVLGLARDFDGDGAKDALAIVAPQNGGAAGEVIFFRGRKGGGVEPQVTVGTPPSVSGAAAAGPGRDLDAGCVPPRRLVQIGTHSAFVELGVSCGRSGASRWLAVVLLQPLPRIHFSGVVVDPANAPKLSIDADGADLDGDGIDDVSLLVTVEGGGAPSEPLPRATARIRWLDRPAGMSRASEEPEGSLRAQVNASLARAGRLKDAPRVPLEVQSIRTLFGAICAEGGGPRLTQVNANGPLKCGPSHALEEAGLALVRANVTLGEHLRAIAALDAAQKPPGTRTAARLTEAQHWIAQAAPTVTATSLRAIAAIPQMDRTHAPSWGALAFEPTGKLLIRTLAGTVREDPALGDEADAADIPPWKPGVLSPDGALRWIEAYYACDALALHATFAPVRDGDPRDVVLPIVPPLAQRCISGVGEPARALPVAWGPRGLEAIIAGEPVLFSSDLARASLAVGSLDQPVSPGAPRSPNGKVTSIPTSQGIVVRGVKTYIYRARDLEGVYGELRDCTVSDDSEHVACIRGGRAFVGTWALPAGG